MMLEISIWRGKQVLKTTLPFKDNQDFNPIGYNPVTAPKGYTDEQMKKASRIDFKKVSLKGKKWK